MTNLNEAGPIAGLHYRQLVIRERSGTGIRAYTVGAMLDVLYVIGLIDDDTRVGDEVPLMAAIAACTDIADWDAVLRELRKFGIADGTGLVGTWRVPIGSYYRAVDECTACELPTEAGSTVRISRVMPTE